MHFLVDAQLPPALAKWLGAQGHTASHVLDLRLDRAPDTAIWNRAIELGAVIVTKDEDFAVRRILASGGPIVVWVRFGNTTRPEVLSRFEGLLPRVLDAIQAGEQLVEIG